MGSRKASDRVGSQALERPTVFVAPSERHPSIRGLATRFSQLPERYGCDILWRVNGDWWGVQRKEIKDFIASVRDGRLGVELGQMKGHIPMPLIMLEGVPRWTIEGTLADIPFSKAISRREWEGMMFGVMAQGARILTTRNQDETAAMTEHFIEWSAKDGHKSLISRPGATPATMWGKASNRDWARHFLQGFPGIGPTTAEAIIVAFGGVPLTWTCTTKELLAVDGIGKERAKTLMETFHVEPEA